jgi:hypothetical protein
MKTQSLLKAGQSCQKILIHLLTEVDLSQELPFISRESNLSAKTTTRLNGTGSNQVVKPAFPSKTSQWLSVETPSAI